MDKAILYKLTFPNGKCYIGITKKTLEQRVKRHISYARSGKDFLISRAIRKYGEFSFTSEILDVGTWDEMKTAEISAISMSNANWVNGYNMTGGGEGGRLGVSLSDDVKLKISSSLKGRKVSESTLRNMSEGQKRRFSGSAGDSVSELTKIKMSQSAKLRSSQPMPAPDREARRLALIGRKRPPEVMKRIWETRKRNKEIQAGVSAPATINFNSVEFDTSAGFLNKRREP